MDIKKIIILIGILFASHTFGLSKINKNNLSLSPTLPHYLLNDKEKHLIHFIKNTIKTSNYTRYKLGGTKIDISRGIYIIDCSRYVDYILKNTYPVAYSCLTKWSGTDKPTTSHFYHYFLNLDNDSLHWNNINTVEKLRPGDILVFKHKNKRNSGHIMIVMDKPLKLGHDFLVRIADSAPYRHSQDTRLSRSSGIGIGTIVLKVKPNTLQPYAYAWKKGSPWKKNVNIAMARPIHTDNNT